MIDKTKFHISHSDQFLGDFLGVSFKIILWGNGEAHTPGGQGIWNYYIYLTEKAVKDFSKFWLKPKVTNEFNLPFVTYDYFSLPLLFPGGPTFYEKHGEVPGHRYVEIGCDYNHSWNHEKPPTYDEIIRDLFNTIKHVQQHLK